MIRVSEFFKCLSTGTGTTCKPAFFIGLRGSGEPETKGSLGDTVWVYYDKFKTAYENAYGESNVDVHGVPYPAVAPNFTIHCVPGDCNPTQLWDRLNNWLHELKLSVDDGATKLRDVLIAQHALCPNQQFVIVGYSQGAWATGEALAEIDVLDPALLSHIAAVVLLGDPKLWWRDPDFEGIATKRPPEWGSREPFYMPGMSNPSQPGSFQFRSYCYGQDPFCNATRLHPVDDPEGTLEWVRWLLPCVNLDANVCQHMQYATGTLPTEVANWFVERLGQTANIPVITQINFPSTIIGDGQEVNGTVQFTDNNAGVNWAQFDVLKTCADCDSQSFGFDPEVSGLTEGEFGFVMWCTTDIGFSWTMRLTLEDVEGNVSGPVDFSVDCEPPSTDPPIARSFNTKFETEEQSGGGGF